jgi:hypothetical protein
LAPSGTAVTVNVVDPSLILTTFSDGLILMPVIVSCDRTGVENANRATDRMVLASLDRKVFTELINSIVFIVFSKVPI